MIIKDLNTVALDRVIKESDLDYIMNAKSHADKLIQEANNILQQAKIEVENAKKDAYNKVTTELIQANKDSLDQFNKEVDVFINDVISQSSQLIYKILGKFGQENISIGTIKNIINKELGKNRIVDITKITANKKSIAKLKETLNLIYFEAIVWEEDETYNDDECLCNTKLWSMRVNISYVVDNILNTINQLL
jgi:hypothetical protein